MTLVLGAAIVIAYLTGHTKEYDLKNGIPRCPNCGRQISLKASRTHCRSCGTNLMTGKSPLELLAGSPKPVSNQPSKADLAHQAWHARQARDAEVARRREKSRQRAVAKEAVRDQRRREKRSRRQAKVDANGGYSDLQLYGFGFLIVAAPAATVVGLYYLAG